MNPHTCAIDKRFLCFFLQVFPRGSGQVGHQAPSPLPAEVLLPHGLVVSIFEIPKQHLWFDRMVFFGVWNQLPSEQCVRVFSRVAMNCLKKLEIKHFYLGGFPRGPFTERLYRLGQRTVEMRSGQRIKEHHVHVDGVWVSAICRKLWDRHPRIRWKKLGDSFPVITRTFYHDKVEIVIFVPFHNS